MQIGKGIRRSTYSCITTSCEFWLCFLDMIQEDLTIGRHLSIVFIPLLFLIIPHDLQILNILLVHLIMFVFSIISFHR